MSIAFSLIVKIFATVSTGKFNASMLIFMFNPHPFLNKTSLTLSTVEGIISCMFCHVSLVIVPVLVAFFTIIAPEFKPSNVACNVCIIIVSVFKGFVAFKAS